MTGASVDDFIAAVAPAAKREDARTIDALFRKVTGAIPRMWRTRIIGYGDYRTTYASGRDVHWLRTGFSPLKARHSFHFMGAYCDPAASERRKEQLARLGKHTRGASCVYVNTLADIDLAVLAEIIADEWRTMAALYPP